MYHPITIHFLWICGFLQQRHRVRCYVFHIFLVACFLLYPPAGGTPVEFGDLNLRLSFSQCGVGLGSGHTLDLVRGQESSDKIRNPSYESISWFCQLPYVDK